MTAKPNLWVVLVTTPNWITGMRDLKCFTTEQSAKSYVETLNSYAPPLIVEYAPVEKEADLPGWNESKLLKILNSIKLSDEDTARLDAAAKALAKEREVPLEMLFRRCGK